MYGKQTAVTAQQAYESSRRNGGAGSVLTQEQFTKAFNTGRSSKDARIQNSAARQRGEGKVYFGQDVDYGGERYKAASEDMVSGAELDVIKTLAKVTGTDVVFYQSEADMSGRYKGANGFMRNGTMYLDVNAGANRTSEESAVLLTAAHELTHYIRENNAEGYAQLRDFVTRHLIEDGVDIEALAEQKAARENGLLSMDEAVEEVIADSCEMMLEDTQLPEIMAKENPGLYEQIREWIANFAEKLRKAFTGVEARHAEAKAMMKYADELSRIWDSALAGAVRKTETAPNNGTTAPNNGTTAPNNGTTAPNNGTGRVRSSFKGYDKETGKKIYESNFPKGTPREAKAERILHYIQNVWSKKPISLVIRNEDGSSRKIEAQFDPTYSEQQGAETDARKLMGGNKHGSASEKRVTLDLADDYYDIATDATYNYSKGETGKSIATHEGVTQWHYFINDILFQEYGEKETTPYRVTIDVKERSDGQFVYSFSAERQNKRSGTRRTLHADVTHTEDDVGNAQSSETTIPQSDTESNTKYSMRDVAEDDTADERRGRQESYAELRRQNEELRRRAEYWKGQTRTTKEATVRKADTDALARRLTEELHNTDAADTVKEELKRMGDYIVQTDGQELSYAELKDWAAAIADHILSGSETEIESGMEDARHELLDYLKSNKLKINEREMLDLPEGWKREHRRIRFGKDGLPIDTAWMELQEKFGEGAFPSSITSQSDMLFHIADMERAWQPVRGNPFENYMGEMRETVAQDILDTMLSDEIRQTAKTAADRARDRMNKAVAEERTRYNDMKSRMQERIQQVYQEGVARKQEAVAKEKAAFGFWVRNQRKMKKLCAFNEARAESFLQTYSSNTTVGEPINSRRNSISQPGTESSAGFSMFAHQNRVFFVFSQRKPPLNKTRRPQGLRVISSYSSRFHVIALITRLTDREALAGKYAVFAHIIKQLVTAYAAVYEAYSVVLLCKLPHGVLAVYVIHSYSGMRCNIPIYKALQHLCFKSVNEKAAASRSAHIIHFSAAASRKLRFQSAQQIIDIRIEEHTVYRLKVHALVMYVYKLSQSILCFRGAYERRRSLCRGERMVAVSHGKKHPLPLFPAFLRKRRESGEYAPLLILGNEPAAKVPAAEHKVKIIELRELRRVYAFYYLPALIVHEDHDMRQLQRSIPADIDARRYAREHRPLRGADEAFCPGLIAVILQRKCADDAAASPS